MNAKYKVLQATSLVTESQLEEMANEGGWMLVSIVPADGGYYFYFRSENAQVAHR